VLKIYCSLREKSGPILICYEENKMGYLDRDETFVREHHADRFFKCVPLRDVIVRLFSVSQLSCNSKGFKESDLIGKADVVEFYKTDDGTWIPFPKDAVKNVHAQHFPQLL
jgi:hypothetical protein